MTLSDFHLWMCNLYNNGGRKCTIGTITEATKINDDNPYVYNLEHLKGAKLMDIQRNHKIVDTSVGTNHARIGDHDARKWTPRSNITGDVLFLFLYVWVLLFSCNKLSLLCDMLLRLNDMAGLLPKISKNNQTEML